MTMAGQGGRKAKGLPSENTDRYCICEAAIFQNPLLRDSGKIDTFSADPAPLR
ncbi:hypothetical protein D3OALGB2SA_3900 [Olavius algarvensis associated proteobacterium Delta 3]|nr:hypothetical protein D3OALGB2SA_3900 [Olavius algarvensis associated proteobacterium Delta 3]